MFSFMCKEFFMSKSIVGHFKGKDTPHILIEVNQKCNLSCKACYKNRGTYTKPLALIKEEVDFAFTQRNLEAVTLAGGEPTLHPELHEVIRYIKAKGVKVNVLSNGLTLTDELLRQYNNAGLDFIHVHVDSHQKRPDAVHARTEKELDPIRDEILKRIKRNGIMPALSLTLYKSTLSQLRDVVDYVLATEYAPCVLVTLYSDTRGLSEKFSKRVKSSKNIIKTSKSHGEEEVLGADIEAYMKQHYGLDCLLHYSSNKDTNAKRWLFYIVLSIIRPDKTFEYISASYNYLKFQMALDKLHNAIKKRYNFAIFPESKALLVFAMVLSALMSLQPRTIATTARLLWMLMKPGNTISFNQFYFQQPAGLNENGELEFCAACPDATIRNGLVVPVCVADVLSPVIEKGPNDEKRNRMLLDLGLDSINVPKAG